MESVDIPDVVTVRLPRLSGGVKRGLWRARQLQARAYNWGVEHGLTLHAYGEFIASPRNDSAPLTRPNPHRRLRLWVSTGVSHIPSSTLTVWPIPNTAPSVRPEPVGNGTVRRRHYSGR